VPQELRTADFDYHLPPELIAQTPIEPRDHSRLLVLNRRDGSIEHRRFFDLPSYLRSNDLLVFNDSRVIPARLLGRKAGSQGKVELLLLHRIGPKRWQALAKPGRRLGPGIKVEIEGAKKQYVLEIESKSGDGTVIVRLDDEGVIEECGHAPLPPYIQERLSDPERYQTVYARVKGSAAAPTAGLHFTPELLQRIQQQGVKFAFVTLHVGLDTFRPVDEADPREHVIHKEYCELPLETARAIAERRKRGGRIIAVGTTTTRVLETAAKAGGVAPWNGWTSTYILPGHTFRAVDALITNFHLPKSTLLMLVSAFAGKALIDKAYREAIEQRYRFYSFGDAMLIE